jgi:hypothetical protein
MNNSTIENDASEISNVVELKKPRKRKPKPDWEVEYNQFIEDFNKTHAQVMIGGNHRIMRIVDAQNSINNRDTYEFIRQTELEKINQNKKIKTSEYADSNGVLKSVYKNIIKAWATDPSSRIYAGGVIFRPTVNNESNHSKDYFNTWQGWTIQPKAGDWTLIKTHIEDVVCQGNQELIDYFFNWIAYTFQNPDKPAGSALVLRGKKGTGKGMIGNLLCAMWGNHALHITAATHLVGQFNGHFNDVCLVYADEAFFSADRSHEGVLKGLITEPNIIVERKGIDAIQQPNYLKVFMTTNSDWAVPASKDERRYCVIDVSEHQRGNREYFNDLSKDCADKNIQAAFLEAMLTRDLKGFHTGNIPETKGLRDQRYHSLDSAGKWMVECLIRGWVVREAEGSGIWHSELTSEQFYESYNQFCNENKVNSYDKKSLYLLSKYLKTFFKKKLIGPARKQGFFLGSLEEATVIVEREEKIHIEREDEGIDP